MSGGGSSPGAEKLHDPGPDEARRRAEALGEVQTLQRTAEGATIRFGTAGWTDATLTASGVFYPPGARSPEDRLRYYASRFPLVEVDATYYALPTAAMVERWVERTPAHFVFDVKAFALMTGHATDVARLPKALREALPSALAARPRLQPSELPGELLDEAWRLFIDALQPLARAGKLGGVLLQFPPWLHPTREGARTILSAWRRLTAAGMRGTVELRNAAWFAGDAGERTLAWLARHEMPFVMVDAPPGHANSVPRISRVTSPQLAVVRFHGRRVETWATPGVGVAERFRYLYDPSELAQWVAPIREAARAAREVHVVMNNCHANYGTTNALELARLVAGA